MKQGDFSELAKAYVNRPGYSLKVLDIIGNTPEEQRASKKIADVGAGTGKLTENLLDLGYTVDAVEPNSSMMGEGIAYTKSRNVIWKQGSGEKTGLESNTYDWVLMGSSFHWVDFKQGTKEFHRILKEEGKFTAVWNPRNIQQNELHKTIERKIFEIASNIQRKSSGSSGITIELTQMLNRSKYFNEVIFIESEYELSISREKYIGAWHSTNDIQAQAGVEKWRKIIEMIENETQGMKYVPVPYKTRAWTAYVEK